MKYQYPCIKSTCVGRVNGRLYFDNFLKTKHPIQQSEHNRDPCTLIKIDDKLTVSQSHEKAYQVSLN